MYIAALTIINAVAALQLPLQREPGLFLKIWKMGAVMRIKAIVLACLTLASFGFFSASANAASTLGVKYFAVQNGGPGSDYSSQPSTPTDFGVCCSSGPATSPDIALGSGLYDGMPIAGTGSDVVEKGANNQILWWTPSSQTGIFAAGSSTLAVQVQNYMFYSHALGPNQTSGDGNYYETAILSGKLYGEDQDVTLSLASDDDALVYIDGTYRGGVEGVTCCGTATIDLGTVTGTHSIEVFYADRAQVNAYLDLNFAGATTAAVPEPAVWAILLLGFFGIGSMVRGNRRNTAIAAG